MILSIILLVSQVFASVDLESFEFNDSGASFNTFINNGTVDSSWNFGSVSAVETDGSGNLSIGPNLPNGQVYRKIDYSGYPYSSGTYRLEIDFDSASLRQVIITEILELAWVVKWSRLMI